MMNCLSAQLSEILETSQQSGVLTLHDCDTLKEAILSDVLNDDDREIIDQLLELFRQGLLKLYFE
jgi:hypothetical protein